MIANPFLFGVHSQVESRKPLSSWIVPSGHPSNWLPDLHFTPSGKVTPAVVFGNNKWNFYIFIALSNRRNQLNFFEISIQNIFKSGFQICYHTWKTLVRIGIIFVDKKFRVKSFVRVKTKHVIGEPPIIGNRTDLN